MHFEFPRPQGHSLDDLGGQNQGQIRTRRPKLPTGPSLLEAEIGLIIPEKPSKKLVSPLERKKRRKNAPLDCRLRRSKKGKKKV